MQPNLIAQFYKYKDGDESSFAFIYEATADHIWAFIRRRVHSSKQEDCFQQFWLHLHTKKNLYLGQPVLPWMYVILRNLIIDEYRSQRALSFESIDESLDTEIKETLEEVLSELGTQDRELIERIYLQGFSYQDLEKEWGLSQTSLRKRLSRGIGSLAQKFKERK